MDFWEAIPKDLLGWVAGICSQIKKKHFLDLI